MKALIFLTLLVSLSSGMVFEGTVSSYWFMKMIFSTLGKFSMGIGHGNYTLELWLESKSSSNIPEKPLDLQLGLFTYSAWQRQRKLKECQERAQESVYKTNFQLGWNDEKLVLGPQKLGQDQGIQVWHFALINCDAEAAENLKNGKINYRLTIFNSDGSHLSEDENGLIGFIALLCIGQLIFLSTFARKFIRFYVKQEGIDYPLLLLLIAILIEVINLLLDFFDLAFLSIDGQGYRVLGGFQIIFSNVSQALIAMIFISMAYGWTVAEQSKDDKELFRLFAGLFLIMSFVIAIAGAYSNRDQNSFHDYQNAAGIFFIMMKIAVFVWFFIQVYLSYQKSSPELKKHYRNLSLFGSLYLLSLPVAVLIAQMGLQPYNRHKVITIVVNFSQVLALIVYSFVLSDKKSEFYPITYKNRQFLPMSKLS